MPTLTFMISSWCYKDIGLSGFGSRASEAWPQMRQTRASQFIADIMHLGSKTFQIIAYWQKWYILVQRHNIMQIFNQHGSRCGIHAGVMCCQGYPLPSLALLLLTYYYQANSWEKLHECTHTLYNTLNRKDLPHMVHWIGQKSKNLVKNPISG